MKSESLVNAAMAVLVVCAVVVTGLVVRRELFPPAAAASIPPVTIVENWREYAQAGHRMGPAAAPVSIAVFADFQCPYCAMAAPSLHELRVRHPHDVAVIFRHYPLPSHLYAAAAARASECAADQGRFEAFHDAADRAGVADRAAFEACVGRDAPLDVLARDADVADRLGVTGTPTILVNQYRFRGAAPLDALEAYVRRALTSSRQARAPRVGAASG
jgi:predicted DsbA family dithiol-disulfide isomerase